MNISQQILSDILSDLSQLEDNWDGCGSKAIDKKAISIAAETIVIIEHHCSQPKTIWIFPSVCSGVKIEATYGEKEIGIWIEPPLYQFKTLLMEEGGLTKSYLIKDNVDLPFILDWLFK